MTRSVWKNIYIDNVVLHQLLGPVCDEIVPHINSRGSTILKEFVGKSVAVYNGKQFFVVAINNLMPGRKFGEFAQTKKICVYRRTKKASKKNFKR